MINSGLSEIKQVALEIYGGCNYKCTMCPQDEGRHRDFLKKLPFEIFEKIIVDAANHGCTAVSLHGSGEATLHPEIGKFIRLVKKFGMKCVTVSNGYMLDESLSKEIIDAGLDYIRISGIGYDRDSYMSWMKKDAFELVRNNVKKLEEMRLKANSNLKVGLYHLILNPLNKDEEINLYRENWINFCGNIEAEIWQMHNWAGTYNEIPFPRSPSKRRSCGRPNAPYLNVRAGGLNGQLASVVPCCFVLGRDEQAVLGNLETQTIQQVLNGDLYKNLKQNHDKKEFDKIDYCKNCDQLYDSPESLVWTNITGKQYGQSKILKDLDYREFATSSEILI